MELQNKIVGLIGRKGSGKSTLLRAVLSRCPRFLLWDPMAEHDWCPNYINELDELDGFLAWTYKRETFAGRYVSEGDMESDFPEICNAVYDTGGLAFAIEEISFLCTPSSVPQELDRLVRLGRHRRVDLVWTAQRAAEVARRVTAATDLLLLLSQTEPRDLDAIADRCGHDVAERIAGLPLHGMLAWDAIQHRAIPKDEAESVLCAANDENRL